VLVCGPLEKRARAADERWIVVFESDHTGCCSAVDWLDKDGVLELLLNNEGQESAVLLGDPRRLATPIAAR
jgi:hypothetical protein